MDCNGCFSAEAQEEYVIDGCLPSRRYVDRWSYSPESLDLNLGSLSRVRVCVETAAGKVITIEN